ncbi:heavy metal-binding domain-containing protein [Albidovulum aquaemixtae]|nr:heavy metal-binding domain-containing protein [Defluviimonas aquaemixtae]
MHSEIRQSEPGRCPTCHMNLVPEGEARVPKSRI